MSLFTYEMIRKAYNAAAKELRYNLLPEEHPSDVKTEEASKSLKDALFLVDQFSQVIQRELDGCEGKW